MTGHNYVLLLGAGFSRNWGGWLADEAFEYLMGRPELGPLHRRLLWECWGHGGFEAALGKLQDDPATKAELASFERALEHMFRDMNRGYQSQSFPDDLTQLLVRFDAIFTLNQDLLIERLYYNSGAWVSGVRKWSGLHIAGMTSTDLQANEFARINGVMVPQAPFALLPEHQPYLKLHGSSNWRDASGSGVLVVGNHKSRTIGAHPVLAWLLEQLRAHLNKASTRLMVIGYSFADEHVNAAIVDAAKRDDFGLFVIDPLGLSVMDRNRGAAIHTPGDFLRAVHGRVIGASRRHIIRTFDGSDPVERTKVLRFFKN